MQTKITSLDRGLRILDTLSSESQGLGVTEISRRVAADKSVVYRTLSLLMAHDYVELYRMAAQGGLPAEPDLPERMGWRKGVAGKAS